MEWRTKREISFLLIYLTFDLFSSCKSSSAVPYLDLLWPVLSFIGEINIHLSNFIYTVRFSQNLSPRLIGIHSSLQKVWSRQKVLRRSCSCQTLTELFKKQEKGEDFASEWDDEMTFHWFGQVCLKAPPITR